MNSSGIFSEKKGTQWGGGVVVTAISMRFYAENSNPLQRHG